MTYTRKTVLAAVAAVLASAALGQASAGDLVANPETVFAKGLKWIDKHGENKGVLQLSPRGSALINWNGTTYRGRWEKVGEYHVKTTWETGGPPGSVWSLRETGDPTAPYVASRRMP